MLNGYAESTLRPHVLIVEDDAIASDMEQFALEQAGLTVRVVTSAAEAVRALDTEAISAVVLDYQLPDGDPWRVAGVASNRTPRIPVIMVTGTGSERLAAEALHRRIDGYVKKAPSYCDALPGLVCRAIVDAHAEDARRRSSSLFQLIESNTADLIATTDVKGVFRYVSSASHRFFDLAPEDLVGRQSLDFVHPDDQSTLLTWLSAADKRSHTQRFTCRCRRHDDMYTWVEAHATVVRNPSGGEAVELLYVIRDITERKLAEERGRGELMAANEELAAFSYSVSHDLRAPLRIVNGFSYLLAEKYTELLDEEGLRFLETIQKSSDQMSEMIDSFLRLFRLRNDTLRIAAIDMNTLVEDLIKTTAHLHPRVRISVGPLPSVAGDSGLIQQVWVNLLGNAVKFTQHREAPRIAIGAQIEGDHVRYSIVDNGVGFDPNECTQLFNPFQRLHGKEFEGTGIGLAIVARIIKQHGGAVAAAGVLDRGATLSFTLPFAPRAEKV